jgi:hypothetical protein
VKKLPDDFNTIVIRNEYFSMSIYQGFTSILQYLIMGGVCGIIIFLYVEGKNFKHYYYP